MFVFYVVFLFVFWVVLGSFWGVIWGHFWTIFGSQVSKLVFEKCCFSIGFSNRFASWRVLCSSYVGLLSVLVSLRFFDRFLVASRLDFGLIFGGLWAPKSVIFGIDF